MITGRSWRFWTPIALIAIVSTARNWKSLNQIEVVPVVPSEILVAPGSVDAAKEKGEVESSEQPKDILLESQSSTKPLSKSTTNGNTTSTNDSMVISFDDEEGPTDKSNSLAEDMSASETTPTSTTSNTTETNTTLPHVPGGAFIHVGKTGEYIQCE